jgi:hypothetical protein
MGRSRIIDGELSTDNSPFYIMTSQKTKTGKHISKNFWYIAVIFWATVGIFNVYVYVSTNIRERKESRIPELCPPLGNLLLVFFLFLWGPLCSGYTFPLFVQLRKSRQLRKKNKQKLGGSHEAQ